MNSEPQKDETEDSDEHATDNIAAVDEWVQRAYTRLHKIAQLQMQREYPGQTLSATSLVNELFVRMRGNCKVDFADEKHFVSIAAQEMSRILIDVARRKKAEKRGGKLKKQTLHDLPSQKTAADSVEEIVEAVDAFEKIDPTKAQLVRLRYFLGMSENEAAQTLGISRATAARRWSFARAWLLDFLTESPPNKNENSS